MTGRASNSGPISCFRACRISVLETRCSSMTRLATNRNYVASFGGGNCSDAATIEVGSAISHGQTGSCRVSRTLQLLMDSMGGRYGEPANERPCSLLIQFTGFARPPNANRKEPRSRFLRTTTRLGAMGAKMSEAMVLRNPPPPPHVLMLAEIHLPISISALGTRKTTSLSR